MTRTAKSHCASAAGSGSAHNPDEAHDRVENNPSLFEEAMNMALASISVFAIADIRHLARTQQLRSQDDNNQHNEEVLRLPMAADRMQQLWTQNIEALRHRRSSDTLTLVEPYLITPNVDNGRVGGGGGGAPLLNLETISIQHVGDENASTECVYIISTDSSTKRIIVAFRGSVTLNDWLIDANTEMTFMANPAFPLEPAKQPETIGIHMGFHEYLYGEATAKTTKNGKDEQPSSSSKVKLIINQLKELREKHPDYSIFLTGHSLGGALALLFGALEAAIAFNDGVPVTCIAIGTPKTGNHQLWSVVQLLERKRRLRCLCILNHLDLVPMLPENRLRRRRNYKFCHVGFYLTLYRGDRFEIAHSGEKKRDYPKAKYGAGCIRNCRLKDRLNQHNYREYVDSLSQKKQKLSNLFLDDFYREEMGLS